MNGQLRSWLKTLPGVVLCAVILVGCVERTISITSQPTGSLVYLNDEEVGRTPLTAPHLFYGTYDVRLTHAQEWVPVDQAEQILKLDQAQLANLITAGQIENRSLDGSQQVRIRYKPLWTKRATQAPWWEWPGPDLIAEMVPNNKVQNRWHFTLEPVGPVDFDLLVDRANQLGATLEEQPQPTTP